MKLYERINVLIQATTISQRKGALTLDDAVNAKNAIDVLSNGEINQNFATAINTLIEIVASSQMKGVYTLKDAYMIYIAIEDIEREFQNEVNRISGVVTHQEEPKSQEEHQNNNEESVILIPPKKMNRKS